MDDQISKSLILDLLSDYEKMRAEDPDEYQITLDCETFLTLLGQHSGT